MARRRAGGAQAAGLIFAPLARAGGGIGHASCGFTWPPSSSSLELARTKREAAEDAPWGMPVFSLAPRRARGGLCTLGDQELTPRHPAWLSSRPGSLSAGEAGALPRGGAWIFAMRWTHLDCAESVFLVLRVGEGVTIARGRSRTARCSEERPSRFLPLG